jgi:hypothetical protein
MFSPLAKGNGSWDGYFDEEVFKNDLYIDRIVVEPKQTSEIEMLSPCIYAFASLHGGIDASFVICF